MAAQEFDGMKEQLDLEQSLRVQAETFAHEVRNPGFLLAQVRWSCDLRYWPVRWRLGRRRPAARVLIMC